METWIAEGRVSINGKIAGVGDGVSEGDEVRVDGRLVPSARLFQRVIRVIGYHKPAGKVCSRSDEQGRPTVYEDLPHPRGGRWLSIGRLDFNTTGLLLFTTDGELAHKLMHPSTGVEREYAVRVLGTVRPEVLERLRSGVELEDGLAKFDSIVEAGGEGANRWYHVTLHEGRNREVRRLWESQGLTVSRLTRVRYGPMILPRDQRAGRWWEVAPEEVDALLALAKLDGATVARPRKDARNDATKRRPPHASDRKSQASRRGRDTRKQERNDWTSTPPDRLSRERSDLGARGTSGKNSAKRIPGAVRVKSTNQSPPRPRPGKKAPSAKPTKPSRPRRGA
jgi:23S rRNA pseudouridine2605 synthase